MTDRDPSIGADGLTRHDRDLIRDVLARYPQVRRVTLFGSRAMGTFGRGSDIDLALEGPDLDARTLTRIATELEDSDLPYKVDLLLRDDQLDPKLEAHIRRHGKPLVWEPTTLGNYMDVKHGFASKSVLELQNEAILLVEDGNHGEYRPRTDEFGQGDYAFIRAADMNDGRVLFASAEKINDDAMARIRKGIGRGGDVLFSHKGTVGKVAFVPLDAPPFVCSPQTTFWRTLDEERLDRRYLYFFMRSRAFIEQWTARCNETDMAAYVSLTAQRQLKVALPEIVEQRAIASVLGALDDKIEQNRRTARALERLARAIFRAWFVDFEPVKAKAAGATAFPSMPQPVFDALPTRFVDSAIGPVPEGWEVKSITQIATFLNGLALQKYPPRNDGEDLRVIKIAQLRKGSTEGADWANSDVPRQYIVDDGDLLFSWSGTLEAEFWFGGKGALNQHLFKVTSTHFPIWFCFLWIRHHLPDFRTIAAGKATTMGHIQRSHLQDAHVVVPPKDTLQKAHAIIGALYDLHAQSIIESRHLAALRDYLLPQLLSGNVRVKDAERRETAA